MSEELRKLAVHLREKAASIDADKMLRAGQTIKAAMALNILRDKVTPHVS